MDYSQWQQPPLTAIAEVNQSAVDAYYPSNYTHYAPVSDQSQNSYPNFGFDPKTNDSSAVPTTTPVPVADAYASAYLDYSAAAFQTTNSASYYVLDTDQQNWAWKEAVWVYGTDPHGHEGAMNGSVQPIVAHPYSTGTNHLVQLQVNGLISSKKRSNKVKTVQSAYCEVCKVDCNSQNVLEQHKLGKKHLKNMKNLQSCSLTNTVSSVAVSSVPIIGPQENPDTSVARTTHKKNTKKAAESIGDLETKRRKVMECGAAVESIRFCTTCNVVCNSDIVYMDHLDGQKHAAMARKLMAQTGAIV